MLGVGSDGSDRNFTMENSERPRMSLMVRLSSRTVNRSGMRTKGLGLWSPLSSVVTTVLGTKGSADPFLMSK